MKVRFSILFISFILNFKFKIHSKEYENLYFEGMKYFHQQQYNTAAYLFKKFLSKSDSLIKNFEAKYYLKLANLHLAKQNSKKEISNFAKKNSKTPRASQIWLHIGNDYFSKQDYKEALNYYHKINLNHLASTYKFELTYRYGYSYLNLKEFELANKYFKQIKNKLNEYKYLANYYSGYIFLRQNNFEPALECFKIVEKDKYLKYVVPYMISQTYYRQGLYYKTLEYLKNIEKQNIIVNNEDEIELIKAESNRMLNNFKISLQKYENFNFYNEDNKIDRNIILRNAYSFYKNKNIDKAIKKLETLCLKSDFIAKQALYLIGKIYLINNKKQQASIIFERACKNSNKWKNEEILYLCAKLEYDIGDMQKSIKKFQKFKLEYPNSKYINEVNTLLGKFYLKTNNYDFLLEEIEKISNKTTEIRSIYQKGTFYKGCECFNNGEYKKSIELFEKSLKNSVNLELKKLTKIYLADTYSILEKTDEAKIHYQNLLRNKLNKKHVFKTYYGLAYIEFKKTNYKMSLKYFQQILPMCEELDLEKYYDQDFKYNILLRIADCYYFLNQYDKSIKTYNKFLQKYRNNFHAHLQKGIICSLIDKKSEAEKDFLFIIKKTKNNNLFYYDNAYYNYIIMLFENEEYKKCKIEINKYVTNRKNSKFTKNCLLKLALCYLNLNETSNAIKIYKNIIVNYTRSEEAHNALLELQKFTDDKTFAKYLEIYKDSLLDKKSLENIEFESAKLYFFNKKYEKAILNFNEYLKNYPNGQKIKEAKLFLAQSFNKTNQYNEAIFYFKELLANKEDVYFYKALVQICKLEFKLENYNEALKYYRMLSAYCKTKKDKIISLQGIMRCALNTKNYSLCFENAKQILENTNRPRFILEAKLNIAKYYLEIGDKENAISKLNYIKLQNGGIYSAESIFLLAEIYFKDQKYKKSLKELFILVKKYLKYKIWVEKGFLLIAQNYVSLNETFQALQTLKSVLKESESEFIVSKANERIRLIEDKLLKELENKERKKINITHKKKLKTKNFIKKEKNEFYTLK